MALFIVLGMVVAIAIVVLAVLFLMLSKEGQRKEEESAVPVTDVNQLKKELSSGLLQPQTPKDTNRHADLVAALEPKVLLPTQPVKIPVEDDVYKNRAEALEEELRSINFKAEGQSTEARQMIESLTKENEALKTKQAELNEAEKKLSEWQGEAVGLRAENTTLQTQLDAVNAKTRMLEEEMAAVRVQMGEEIHRANATVTELTREKEILLALPKPQEDGALRQELEALKAEHVQLKQKYDELEKTHQQFQYELIKARAQSSGLERISFNYKNQLEDFLKKVDAAQVSNEHLSQAKNRLEGVLEEVKSQNEELAQKDQLAQFELEKNRSRLASLEREYEILKAQVK